MRFPTGQHILRVGRPACPMHRRIEASDGLTPRSESIRCSGIGNRTSCLVPAWFGRPPRADRIVAQAPRATTRPAVRGCGARHRRLRHVTQCPVRMSASRPPHEAIHRPAPGSRRRAEFAGPIADARRTPRSPGPASPGHAPRRPKRSTRRLRDPRPTGARSGTDPWGPAPDRPPVRPNPGAGLAGAQARRRLGGGLACPSGGV
jgi:hypothetical protein